MSFLSITSHHITSPYDFSPWMKNTPLNGHDYGTMDSMRTPANSGTLPHGAPGVFISQAEYVSLVQVARQYACLRQKLIDGGVDGATIDMLSDPGPNPDTSQTALASPSASRGPEDPNLSAAQEYNPQAPSYYHQANTAASNGSNGQWLHADTDLFPENSSPSIESRGEATGLHDERKESEGGGNFESNLRLERFAQRSVQLLNLADGVSHGDITAAVRGGLLLEVLLRPRERAARVSFVHERDAAAFLDHSREHGLYIKNKRVAAKWSDQQFVLAGHVAHNISRGATRNFVIRGRDPNHTEETIREDLRHIHNLYVVKVEIAKNDCFISTNSVHNAMFARTCMMSRVEYKGSRIEWSADECAQPLSMPPAKPRSHGFQPKPNSSSSASTSMNPMVNRFQLLDLTENDDEDESESS